MISHLPLKAGDRVVAGFMTVSPSAWRQVREFTKDTDWRGCFFGGSTVDPHEVFFPRSLAFRARYNDYGSVEEIPNDLISRMIVEQFKVDLVPRNAEAKEYELWPQINPKKLDLEVLAEVAERGALHVREGARWGEKGKEKRGLLPVGLWMVRADVYKAMVTTIPPSIDQLLDQQEIALKKRLGLVSNTESPNPLGDDMNIIELLQVLRPAHVENQPDFFVGWLDENGDQESKKQVKVAVQSIMEFARFQVAMRWGRYTWMTASGKGSQDDSLGVQRAVAEVVLKVTNRKRKWGW